MKEETESETVLRARPGDPSDPERNTVNSEEQKLQVQKLESLGVLAGAIAHDFNNILTGVLGNAELALAALAQSDPGRGYVSDIQVAARRAADLSRELLAYAGSGELVAEPLDLSKLVDETKCLIAVSVKKKSRIEYDLAKNPNFIEADATQVRQILLNLIINAAEAIDDADGFISVCTRSGQWDAEDLQRKFSGWALVPGRYACLEVSDNGTGMDEATRKRIFRPFFTTKSSGRGLGLAAVLGIVESHKGAIRVASEAGKGTTFSVLFPLTDKTVVAPAPSVRIDDSWRGSGTVLIADDERSVLMVASKMVESLGFSVVTAEDGREAIDMVGRFPGKIHMALIDLTMPGFNGVETVRRMWQIQSDIKVFLMSGYNRQELETRFADNGIFGFIQKPFDFAQVKAQLQATFDPTQVVENLAAETATGSDPSALQEALANHRQRSSGLELAQYDTALRLTHVVERKAKRAAGRLSRMSRLTSNVARKLGVSEEGSRVLAAAAPFHDIGKIGVSQQVLCKPGPLSDAERQIVKRHPVIGSELLSGLSSRIIDAAAEIALKHHERWDGSGYPNGVKGSAIPLFARVVSLVDQYDAIRSSRPYKRACSHEEACDILLCGDGRTEPKHFDPKVLGAFDSLKGDFAEIFGRYQNDVLPIGVSPNH